MLVYQIPELKLMFMMKVFLELLLVWHIFQGISADCLTGKECSNMSENAVKQADSFRCLREQCITCNPKNVSDCYTCERGFWGGFCQHTCHPNCRESSCIKHDGMCNKGCKAGYYSENGNFTFECNKCRDNCLKCSSNKICSQCKIGFWGKTCENECGDNCPIKECNIATGKCKEKCKIGNFLSSNGKCHSCINFCDRCFSADICDTCHPGRYGNMCEKHCGLGCKKCVLTENTCTQCDLGWTLFNFTCTKQKHICPLGKYLEATGFCRPCQSGCLNCSSSTLCLECRNNYFKNTSGVCSACPENCHYGVCEIEGCRPRRETDWAEYTTVGSGLGLLTGVSIVFIGLVLVRCKRRRAPMNHRIRGDL